MKRAEAKHLHELKEENRRLALQCEILESNNNMLYNLLLSEKL